MFAQEHIDQALDKRCVLYYHMGSADDLTLILREIGHPEVSEDDVVERAQAVIAQFNIFNEEKPCYFCGRKQTAHVLCKCFRSQYLTFTNIPNIVGKFPADTVVDTRICPSCLKPYHVRASRPQKAHEKNKGYFAPRFCSACYKKQAPKRSFAKLGDSLNPKEIQTLEQTVSEEPKKKKTRAKKEKEETASP